MGNFYQRLSYSFGNEDAATEHRALQLESGNRALCVTASGDRPLHLLLEDCAEVVAIDLNPVQNYLLELKIAAMAHLDYQDYLAFLGINASDDRLQTLQRLLPYLTPAAQKYWNAHQKLIARGIIYQGACERLILRAGRWIRRLRPRRIKRLFSSASLEEQAAYVEKGWQTPLWKLVWRIALHPSVTRPALKDPGLYENVDSRINVGKHLYSRMHRMFARIPIQSNAFASMLLRGEITTEAFPPYLTEEGYNTIRSRLDRIKIQTGNVIDYLEACPPQCFDRFSISDIASYMDRPSFEKLLHRVHKAARPKARICARQFLSRHNLDPDLVPLFKRETALEEELARDDRWAVYKFMVAEIATAAPLPFLEVNDPLREGNDQSVALER